MSLASSISRAWRRRRAGSDSAAAGSARAGIGALTGADLTAADLHAARFGAQLLEFPDAALLPPHLVVLLANSVQCLRLILLRNPQTSTPGSLRPRC